MVLSKVEIEKSHLIGVSEVCLNNYASPAVAIVGSQALKRTLNMGAILSALMLIFSRFAHHVHTSML